MGTVGIEVHRDLLLSMLDIEIAWRRALDDVPFDPELSDFTENMYWTAFMLYVIGNPADVPAIYRALDSDFDSWAYSDKRLLFGAGGETTLAYLRQHGEPGLVEALTPLARDLDDQGRINIDELYRWYLGEDD